MALAQAQPVKPVDPYANAGFPSFTMPQSNSFNGTSFGDDPILAKVRALNSKYIQSAQASALAEKQRSLIDFGSPDLALQTIHDQNTARAAQQNPFSTLAQLLLGHNQNDLGINEDTNKRNLFYSSTRGFDLTNEGRGYLQRQSLAQNALEAGMRGQDMSVLSAEQVAAERELAAEDAAYQRALAFALANGGGGGNYPPSEVSGNYPTNAADYFAGNPLPQGTTTAQALAALQAATNYFGPSTYDFSGYAGGPAAGFGAVSGPSSPYGGGGLAPSGGFNPYAKTTLIGPK